MDSRGDKRPGGFEKDNNVPSSKRPRRFVDFYRQLEDPDFHDAFILVHDAETGEKKELKVHKSMILAASVVIRTQFSSRWDPLKDPVITLPEEYSVQVATTFIKLLYMDFIDADIRLETVLQIASLCNMYMIEDAMEICNDFVITRITKENCLLIHETYEKIQIGNPRAVINSTLKTIIKNIYELISSTPAVESWSDSNWRTILNLESPWLIETGELFELQLFQHLLQWKNANAAREKPFQEQLLPLMRFPLMTVETLAEKVIPTGVLSEKDALDLLCYNCQSASNKSDGNRKPRFPRFSRTIKFARDSERLDYLLESAAPYDNILLSPTKFSLSSLFVLCQNKVKISGSGNFDSKFTCSGENILRPGDFGLHATTSDSLFTNLEFTCTCSENDDEGEETDESTKHSFSVNGSRNEISKIETDGCTIKIRGKFNNVSNSILKNCCETILIKSGGQNSLNDLSISYAKRGIVLYSGSNVVQNINFRNTITGIYAKNVSFGKFRNISFKFEKKLATGIAIMGGSHNKIYGLSCSPVTPVEKNGNAMPAIGIMLQGNGEGNEVMDFSASLVNVGLRIWENNVKNIVKNFETFDSLFSIQICTSEGNKGENVRCKYSTAFLTNNAKNIKAIDIDDGKGNVFGDVQIVTDGNELEKSGENKESVLKFLQNPNSIFEGEENVISCRNISV